MGSDVGIFWHGLRRGLGDGVGYGYGGVVGHGKVGRCEVGRSNLGRGELGDGEVGHRLTAEVIGF